MKSLKEQILYVRKVLNERKQRLLEFLDDLHVLNLWGFSQIAVHSDKDFIAYVFNSELKKDIEDKEVIEALTYFLCGYDHFKTCEEAVKLDKPKIPVNNYYDIAKENLSVETDDEIGYIAEEELDKKRDFVKAVLENHEVPKLKDL